MAIARNINRKFDYEGKLLGDAFEEFIAEKEAKNLSMSTIRNYTQSYEYFIKFNNLNADTPLSSITPTHFFKWMNQMKLEQVRHTSINHYLRDCRAFFYWCMDSSRAYIKYPFKIEMMSGQEALPKLFSQEDIEKLLEKPRKADGFAEWRTWAIVNWVYATGNRAATVCAVQLEDVNFSTNQIILRHTKNKHAQTIKLTPALDKALKEYLRLWDITDYLFPDIGNNQLTTNALSHSFARYCQRRGVNQTNIHGLRHSFATQYIKNGGNRTVLSRILGHSSLAMTDRYVKLFADDLADDFEEFNPLDTIKRPASRKQAIKRY